MNENLWTAQCMEVGGTSFQAADLRLPQRQYRQHGNSVRLKRQNKNILQVLYSLGKTQPHSNLVKQVEMVE